MDLSFILEPKRRVANWTVSLADIEAEAERRRMDSARLRSARDLRKTQARIDLVHILALHIVQDSIDLEHAAELGGSFNPAVAKQLMVGEQSEESVYLRALADVQG